MAEQTTEVKHLKEITDRLKEASTYNQETWLRSGYISKDVAPADILAVLDQLDRISELTADVHLPMMMLFRTATTLSTSENVQESVIGHNMLICHREMEFLTHFCRDLGVMKVECPVKVESDE